MGQLTEDLKRGILNQSSDGPNWDAVVEWMAEEFEEVMEVSIYLLTLTWLDNAEGVWLDRIGRIVGVTRPQDEELIRVFRVRGASDPWYDENHGFADSTASIGGYLSGRWGVPKEGLVDDDVYREIIRAKIAGTNADASVPGIARYVEAAFGLTCTVTAANRVVKVELNGAFDLRQRRYIEHFSPRLAGVGFSVSNWPEF